VILGKDIAERPGCADTKTEAGSSADNTAAVCFLGRHDEIRGHSKNRH
jgi:hypothetical protein